MAHRIIHSFPFSHPPIPFFFCFSLERVLLMMIIRIIIRIVIMMIIIIK